MKKSGVIILAFLLSACSLFEEPKPKEPDNDLIITKSSFPIENYKYPKELHFKIRKIKVNGIEYIGIKTKDFFGCLKNTKKTKKELINLINDIKKYNNNMKKIEESIKI